MNTKSLHKISKVIGNDFKYNNALFAISSLGLGHASRTLPVIKYYLEQDFSITILSYGNAFNFLKQELKDYKNIIFIKLADYPKFERGEGWKFYWYLFIDTLNFNKTLIKENNFVKTLGDNFDFIFSDGRFGIYKKNTPSFLLTHQISYVMPKGLKYLKNIVNYSNYEYFKRFDAIFIPDYKDESKSLAGELSHTGILKKLKHYYIGTLSSYDDISDNKKDIDYYFIISGYLEEHKQSFINELLEEAKKLDGKKVFVLGDTINNYVKKDKKHNIKIYSSVSSKQRVDFFARSKIIISRAGYTTIMDLVANNKKAILFPTKNQTEQEYLAEYLDKKGLFVNGGQNGYNLKKLLNSLK